MNQNKDIRQIYFLFFAVSNILSYNLYLFGHNLLECRTIAEGLIFTKSGLQNFITVVNRIQQIGHNATN